jgi:hypothetical protein
MKRQITSTKFQIISPACRQAEITKSPHPNPPPQGGRARKGVTLGHLELAFEVYFGFGNWNLTFMVDMRGR